MDHRISGTGGFLSFLSRFRCQLPVAESIEDKKLSCRIVDLDWDRERWDGYGRPGHFSRGQTWGPATCWCSASLSPPAPVWRSPPSSSPASYPPPAPPTTARKSRWTAPTPSRLRSGTPWWWSGSSIIKTRLSTGEIMKCPLYLMSPIQWQGQEKHNYTTR